MRNKHGDDSVVAVSEQSLKYRYHIKKIESLKKEDAKTLVFYEG